MEKERKKVTGQVETDHITRDAIWKEKAWISAAQFCSYFRKRLIQEIPLTAQETECLVFILNEMEATYLALYAPDKEGGIDFSK